MGCCRFSVLSSVFLSVSLLPQTAYTVQQPQGGANLSEAISKVNSDAKSQGYSVLTLNLDGFLNWYRSHRFLTFRKEDRLNMDEYLLKGELPPGYVFEAQTWAQYNLPDRIALNFRTVINGNLYSTWENQYLPFLEQAPASIDENVFLGSPLPPNVSGSFPQSVQVDIQQIRLSWQNTKTDALEIKLLLNKNNISDLATYFGTAYSQAHTQQKLQMLLGDFDEKWISIQELMEGWPVEWLNHFPGEKTIADGTGQGANDVCHGVARQFFRTQLSNSSGSDRSTEASELLLKTYYQVLPESVDPAFGDYLYLPGAHSIRFILSDPHSGRWIGFSSWSSADTPYRLWWVDQDYVGPSAVPPPANPAFPKKMDVWRRHSDLRSKLR